MIDILKEAVVNSCNWCADRSVAILKEFLNNLAFFHGQGVHICKESIWVLSKILLMVEIELQPIEGDKIVSQGLQKDTISWKFIDSFGKAIQKLKRLTNIRNRAISNCWATWISRRNNRCHKSELHTSNLDAIGILNPNPLKLQTDSSRSSIEDNFEDMVDVIRIERCNSCDLCSIDIDGKLFANRYNRRWHICDSYQVLSLGCYEDVLTNLGCCSIGVSVSWLGETDWTGIAFV